MAAVPADTVGLVLAAGAGSRFGMPKSLVRSSDGTPWIGLACRALADGGCADVVVVLGAMAESAIHLVPSGNGIVVAREWSYGQSASLRAGLEACVPSDAEAVVVTLVDLPALSSDAVRSVMVDADAASLKRATYDGRPGHPVLIGRDHWAPLMMALAGDIGARTYLSAHSAEPVDCTDFGGGHDVDEPEGAA